MNEPLGSRPVRLGCYPLGRLDVNGMKGLLSALDGTFAAQWLAYAFPCQRFADALAGICA